LSIVQPHLFLDEREERRNAELSDGSKDVEQKERSQDDPAISINVWRMDDIFLGQKLHGPSLSHPSRPVKNLALR
jgi:hypothetical protein